MGGDGETKMPKIKAQGSVATSQTQDTAIQLDALHKAQIVYTKKIEVERVRLHQVEKKIERMRKTIADFNKTIGGDYLRQERAISTMRQSCRLESQLQTVKEKQDKLQHNIKMLAVEINNKRREKVQHESARKKTERKLLKRQQQLQQLTRQLQDTEEEREQAGRQVENLKLEIVEEMEAFNEKVAAMHSQIVAGTAGANADLGALSQSGSVLSRTPRRPAHPSKRDQLGASAPSKVGGAGGVAMTPPKGGAAGTTFVTERGAAPGGAEVDLQNEVNKAYWVVAKTRMDLTKQIERKEELYSAFDKICSETGVYADQQQQQQQQQQQHAGGAASPSYNATTTTATGSGSPMGASSSSGRGGGDNTMKHPLEQLVPLLLKSEDENYLIFRTINELNQEVEQLQIEKVQLEEEVKARERATLSQRDHETQVKTELSEQLAASERVEQKHHNSLRANEEELVATTEAITALFHKFGCGDTPVGEALLASGLSERNVAQFLGLIEDSLVELLQLDSHINATRPMDPTRPKTPRFTKDGKRLPAMLRPDLQETANLSAGLDAPNNSTLGVDDHSEADADGHDTLPVPIDPMKWLHSLKHGDHLQLHQAHLGHRKITKLPPGQQKDKHPPPSSALDSTVVNTLIAPHVDDLILA